MGLGEISGRCNCGAVRWRMDGAPLAVVACHCSNCRAQSGAAFSVNIAAKAGAVSVDGPIKTFEDRETGSGKPVLREFCGACGSPIRSIATAMPAVVAIKAGTADDPGHFRPTMHIWTGSKLPWVTVPADLPQFERDAR